MPGNLPSADAAPTSSIRGGSRPDPPPSGRIPVTSLSLSDKDPKSIKTDTLVVGVASSDGRAGPGRRRRCCRAPCAPACPAPCAGIGVTGEADQVVRIPAGKDVAATAIALTGLGGRGQGPRRDLRHRDAAPRRGRRHPRTARHDVRHLRAAGQGRRTPWPRSARARCSAPTRSPGTARAPRTTCKAPVSTVTVLTPLAADKAANAAASRAQDVAKRRAPGPRPGEHRPRRPAARRLRRRRRGGREVAPGQGRGAGREGARQGRLRRHPRRRPRLEPPAATGQDHLRPARRQEAPGTDRQGHHVRHRRHLAQAAAGHGDHEVRHGRRRHRRRGGARAGPAARPRSRSPPGCRWPRTCRPGRRSDPPTC